MLAAARPQAYSDLMQQTNGLPAEEIVQVEAERSGFSHLNLAAAMMADWNIPLLFGEAVTFHESPDLFPFAPGSRQFRLVHLLPHASYIARLCVTSLDLAGVELAEIAASAFIEWVEWGDVPQLKAPGPQPIEELLEQFSTNTTQAEDPA